MPIDARIQPLNKKPEKKGKYILYWMQQSQRAEDNHALAFAVERANEKKLPLLVVFGLTDDYPEANLRHYAFMLDGLRETQKALAERDIRMIVRRGRPDAVASEAAKHAALVVCDRGYPRHQVAWREYLAKSADCTVIQVESDVIVPVEVVSSKAEYAARTIRPKIHRHLDDYLTPCPEPAPKISSLGIEDDGVDLSEMETLLDSLDLDRSVPPVSPLFHGGTAAAKARFRAFLNDGMARYTGNRNQPQTDDISKMSPYLHFGQISPLWLALQVKAVEGDLPESAAAYLEELVVRRELSANYVHYTPNYDAYGALPGWAKRSLGEHAADVRDHLYDREALENAQTHDPYWNAAMNEMRHTGFMHNYMRMYWGKKVLEWRPDPQDAFETLLTINNRYFLDGRDPNSYVGVGWIFGLHDRAWFEREIFGKVRYMAASGLKRKCDIDGYVRKVDGLMAS